MPYTDDTYFRSTARVLSAAPWINITNFNKFIRGLTKIEFSYQAERNKIKQLIVELEDVSNDNVYTQTNRFPTDSEYQGPALFMCLDEGEFPKIIAQIGSAGDYKTPDISNTNKDLSEKSLSYISDRNSKTKNNDNGKEDGSGDKITSLSERDRLEKALLSYNNAIMLLRGLIKAEFIDRYRFESKYNLKWS